LAADQALKMAQVVGDAVDSCDAVSAVAEVIATEVVGSEAVLVA
jgi:hypothetical protein